ncbi:MAG: hypothetical protein ACREF7_03175, partial [Candidatus Saccharimonadales bacterium]
MDFSNRGSTPPANQSVNTNNPPSFTSGAGNRQHKSRMKRPVGLAKWGTMGLGVVVVVLIVAVILAVIFGSPKSQSHYVNTSKLQAVFLNTGQVYFGNIGSINTQYLVLDNIFYLQSNSSSSTTTSTTSGSNVSLVKL